MPHQPLASRTGTKAWFSRPIAVGSDDGFILLVVIWVIALLALFATGLASSTQIFIQTNRNDNELRRAEFLASAGVNIALLDLINTMPEASNSKLEVGSSGHTCVLPEGEILRIRIDDEAGKIDLNAASDPLLLALFMGFVVDREAALRLVAAVADFRDADDEPRLNGAERTAYLAAGRATGPKNAPFDATAEIGNVLGISDELARRLRPHLTVYSGQDGIDPRHATSDLLDVLSRAVGTLPTPAGSANDVFTVEGRQIPSQFVTASVAHALMIRSGVRTNAGVELTWNVVVGRQEGTIPQSTPRNGRPATDDNRARARQPLGLSDDGRGEGVVQRFHIWSWEREPFGVAKKASLTKDLTLQPC